MSVLCVSCGENKESGKTEEEVTYTVSFYAKNPTTLEDELFETITVKKGEKVPQTMNIPDDYETEGRNYYFYEWEIKDVLDINKYVVKGDTKVTARYASVKKKFNLTFDCGDFYHYESEVEYGDKITYTGPMPSKECKEEGYEYVFQGFSRIKKDEIPEAGQDDFSDLLDENSTVVKTETFYPRYVKVRKTCSVKYYDFQGDLSFVTTVEYGDKIKKRTDKDKSERLGYSFVGFYYFDADGILIDDNADEIEVKSNISVKEIWNTDPVEYELTYLSMDNVFSTVKYTIEDEINVSSVVPKANGCTFSGWYDKSTEERVTYIHKGSYGPRVLVAKYKANPTIGKDLSPVVESKLGNNVVLEFTVDAPVGSVITYQWYKDGNIIENAVGETYTVLGLEKNNGEYNCTAKVEIKGAETATVSSTPSLVYISDSEAKLITITYRLHGEVKQKQIKVGGKADLSEIPEGYTENGREYVFDRWETDGATFPATKMFLKDTAIDAVYLPVYVVNYQYNGKVIDSEKVVKGHSPKAVLSESALDQLPDAKVGYVWSPGISSDDVIDRDTDVTCKMELENDVRVFLEQSLDCVFNDKEIGFTVNLKLADTTLKLFVTVKVTGLKVEDLHGLGRDFTIAELLQSVDLKIKTGTTNPVTLRIANKTLYVTTNDGTFKVGYENLVDILESTGLINIKDLIGPEYESINDVIVNMVDVIDKTAETVSSITLDTATNTLTVIPNIDTGISLTISSDVINDRYSVRTVDFAYGDKISMNCAVTQGLSIPSVSDGEAVDYSDSIKNLTDAVINLMNGRHYKISGNVTLDSPSANIGVTAEIDRYEVGDTDYYGNPVTEKFSTYHVTVNLPKISMVVSIVKSATVSEIFVDSRYPDVILFKRTVGSSVEYKSNKDFMKDGQLDTMSLVVWFANLGSIVNSFAGSSMTVTLDMANALKGISYANGTSTIVLSKDAVVFSDDMVAINKDVVISVGVRDGYPTALKVTTAMSLAGILKPNISLELALDDAVTKNGTDLGTQKAYDDLKKNNFSDL